MKTTWKTKMAGAVCAGLSIALLLGGCGTQSGTATQNEAGLNPPGEFPVTQEKTTLTFFVPKTQYVEDYATNEFTKWYEDKTNIQIQWQVASGDLAQAKNVMLASGNYPDVLMNCNVNRSEQLVYGEQEIFQDLAPLLETDTKYLKEILAQRPQIKQALTTPGGQIFGLPSIGEVYHTLYNAKMWVYKPWLDKLEIALPETTEEFYQMLKAFKEKDPNGNGKADEIPLASVAGLGAAGMDDYLMSPFLFCNAERITLEDGKIKFAGDTEEYREGLRYIHKLYEEGLILKDSLVMDRKALTALGENPDVPILGTAPSLWPGMFTVAGGESGRDKQYVAVPPLKGPSGLRQARKINYKYSGDSFNVTKNCKNTKAALRWADWFYTMEGTLTSQYGQENVGWKRAEEGQKGLDGNPATWVQLQKFGTLQNTNWMNFGLVYKNEKLALSGAEEGENSLEAVLYRETKEKYEPYSADKTPPELFFNQQQSTEYTGLKTQIDSELSKSFAAFVSGEQSLDSDWDAYCQRLKTLGVDRYVELYQTVYDENQKNK